MLHESGLTEQAVAVLKPVVAYFDETNDPYGNNETRTSLAALYHALGDYEQRDRALQPVIDRHQRLIRNGLDHSGSDFVKAVIEAVRGDTDAAVLHVEAAIDRGFRFTANFVGYLAFDNIRDDPRLEALIARIAADNQAQLSSVTD